MIVNVWREPPPGATGLLALARAHGFGNLPLCDHDVHVAWRRAPSAAAGGVLIERHIPCRHYSATAPDFETLLGALAWEAREWVAVEIWRAAHKAAALTPVRDRGVAAPS